ncbi:MAG: YfhO family protein [Balneolales bacterium]|nr:YfhO family protein [Balneolales bacterium]
MPKKRRPTRSSLKETTSSPVDFWDKIPVKYQHLACLLFLLLLPVVQYSDVIIGDQRFFSPDIVQWRASAESVIQHREEFNEEALWSSNMFSGMPAFIVSYKRSVPHIDEIFTWLAPIFPAAALWIMAVGLYVFFLRLKLHPLAATVGALLIVLSTYIPIIVGAGHNAKVYALAFIPWMFASYLILSRTNRKWLGLGLLALSVMLELRAGHPQVTYFFLYLLAIWWGWDTYKAWKHQELPGWLKKTGLIAGAGLLALAANVQPYWSIYEYSPYSIRGGAVAEERSGLDIDYAMAWSHGWFELTTLAVPGIMGGASTDNMYWGPKSVTSGPHYLGAIAFFLILLALFNYKNGIKWVFLGAAGLSALFALGENFLFFNMLFFEYMPLFNKFRAPEKWLMVTTFSLNVLAAMGAHWLVSKETATRKFTLGIRSLDWPSGITIATGILLLILVNTSLTFEKPGERRMLAEQVAQQNNVSASDPRVMEVVNSFLMDVQEDRETLAQNDTLRFLMFSGVAIVLAGLVITGKLAGAIALLIVLLLLAADLISTGNRYIPDSSKISSSISQTDFMERQRRPHHTFIQNQNEQFAYPYRVFPLDQNPFNNAIPAYFFPSAGGYTGAKMSRYQEAIDNAFFISPTGINFGLMDMLNIRYITANAEYPFPGFETIYEGDDGYVLENGGVLPKIFFPENVRGAESPAAALEFISSPNFDALQESILEKTTGELLPHSADLSARMRITEYNARTISAEIQKSEAGYVAISEMYYPAGWRAYLNGEEIPIFAMNFLLRSVHVPAGEHTLELYFDPASHRIGTMLSWFFNLMIAGILGFGIFRYSQDQKTRESESLADKSISESKS